LHRDGCGAVERCDARPDAPCGSDGRDSLSDVTRSRAETSELPLQNHSALDSGRTSTVITLAPSSDGVTTTSHATVANGAAATPHPASIDVSRTADRSSSIPSSDSPPVIDGANAANEALRPHEWAAAASAEVQRKLHTPSELHGLVNCFFSLGKGAAIMHRFHTKREEKIEQELDSSHDHALRSRSLVLASFLHFAHAVPVLTRASRDMNL